MAVDVGTVILLAAVTLLDGVRPARRGTIVLQRLWRREWSLAIEQDDARFRLYSWWSPLYASIILPIGSGTEYGDVDAARARLHDIAPWVTCLHAAGALTLLAMVIGVPFGAGFYGGAGFLIALAVVLSLAFTTASIAAACCYATGDGCWAALRWALPYASPFTAPRTGDALLERFLRMLPPAVAVQNLLDADVFLRWLRPFAYDAAQSRTSDIESMLLGLSEDVLERALDTYGTTDADARFRCERCGEYFAHGVACADCDLPLTSCAPEPHVRQMS